MAALVLTAPAYADAIFRRGNNHQRNEHIMTMRFGIALASLFLVTSLYADIVMIPGNNAMNPEDNVTNTTGMASPGMFLAGRINSRPDVAAVHIASTTDTLTGASGSCCIHSQDGLINNFTLTIPDFAFTHVIFSLARPVNRPDITITAFACTPNVSAGFCGSEVEVTKSNIVANSGFVTINSVADEVITKVTINSASGFVDIGQIRLGTGQNELMPALPPIPEPPSMLLLGSGLLVFTQVLRRKLL